MYHYDKKWKNKKINRLSLCISTQIWCPVWCIFCVTWKLWLTRNLTTDEILNQILIANNYLKNKLWKKEDWTRRKVRNVVYMWMWEPFLNYEQVINSIPYLADVKYLWLSKRRITISTSWITPAIEQFTKDNPPCSLAFSLHAPNQELREKLVPFAKQFKLNEIMEQLQIYSKKTWNTVFYEYVIIKNLNDSDKIAHQTWKLLQNRKAHLNLIPYNQNPTINLEEPLEQKIREFQKIVESYWITVTIRWNMGRQTKSACWQLWREEVQKKY
jgi:23S rRNA (adenine2503-C2)-methyltransferase